MSKALFWLVASAPTMKQSIMVEGGSPHRDAHLVVSRQQIKPFQAQPQWPAPCLLNITIGL